MTIKRIWQITKRNWPLTLAIAFFVTYRLIFTFFLFEGRLVPPEPDDSYYYLAHAKKFPTIENFEDFRLAFFSAGIKFISIFTGSNLEIAYKVNFFVGPFIILIPILRLVFSLTKSQKEAALFLFLLTLYSGSGAYHGFYWVVPSYYHLALYFAVLSIVFATRKVRISVVALTCFLLIFSHPTSVILIGLFIFYSVLLLAFSKKIFTESSENLKQVLLAMSVSYVFYFLISKMLPAADSPQSLEVGQKYFLDFFKGNVMPVSFSNVTKEYFSILFINPLSALGYLIVLAIALKKNMRLITLYFATVAVVLIGSFLPYGVRTLTYLWPITFLIVANAAYQSYISTKNKLMQGTVIISIILFAVVCTLFNHIWVQSLNESKDYYWNRECASKMLDETTFHTSLEGMNAFNLYGANRDSQYFLSEENILKSANINSQIIFTGTLIQKQQKLGKIENFLAANLTRNELKKSETPINSWTAKPLDRHQTANVLDTLGLEYNSSSDCGYFEIVSLKNK